MSQQLCLFAPEPCTNTPPAQSQSFSKPPITSNAAVPPEDCTSQIGEQSRDQDLFSPKEKHQKIPSAKGSHGSVSLCFGGERKVSDVCSEMQSETKCKTKCKTESKNKSQSCIKHNKSRTWELKKNISIKSSTFRCQTHQQIQSEESSIVVL